MPDEPSHPRRLGAYDLLEQIGRGPLCTVWRGRAVGSGPAVAIKVLEPRFAADAGRVARFAAEARRAQALDHPHIVRVHEVAEGAAVELPYFVMDYLPGGHAGRLRGAPVADFPNVACRFAEVCDALAYIHGRGLVHCDVKPGNILFDGAGRAVLADFGLAATADELAGEGAAGGTLAYMAPEQIASFTEGPAAAAPVDARADLYALGVVLFEVLTGEPPFRAGNRFSLLYQRLTADPPQPSQRRPDVPPDLDRVVVTALSPDPADRFPCASAMAAALRAAADRLAPNGV